jgi:TolB protein
MRRFTALVVGLIVAVPAHPAALLGDDEVENAPLLTVAANRFGSSFELVTIDIHGENAKLVLPSPHGGNSPCWSPDVRKIAYRNSSPSQLYLYDFDSGEETNLTKTVLAEHEPTWSPDGKKLLFTSQRTGDPELFLMDADGSNPIKLTNNPGWDCNPAWSPDGKKIVFGSNPARGAQRLYVMDADGSNVRDLLGHAIDGWAGPSWSPDGSQIVYVGPHNGSLQIFVVSADGKGEQPLTDSPGGNAWPAYSPDGRYIAYLHCDGRPEKSAEQGTLMVYDVETLAHTAVAPEGMRAQCRISWKPSPRKDTPPVGPFPSTQRSGD